MSKMPISKRTNNDERTGVTPLSTHFPHIDDFFDTFARSWPFSRSSSPSVESTEFNLNPSIDIVEDNSSYTLSAELPGLDLKDINLDLSDGILTLSGEKKAV